MASKAVVLIGPFATRWVVIVGESWYEMEGASTPDCDANSGTGACARSYVGMTKKSPAQIDEFLIEWRKENPEYNFVEDFTDFLCDGTAKLPAGIPLRGISPTPTPASTPRPLATLPDGTARAEATTGRSETQHGPAHAADGTPSAGAQAVCGKTFGEFERISAGRAEVANGRFRVHAELNINSGSDFQNEECEAAVLGFGDKVGDDGHELNTLFESIKSISHERPDSAKGTRREYCGANCMIM